MGSFRNNQRLIREISKGLITAEIEDVLRAEKEKNINRFSILTTNSRAIPLEDQVLGNLNHLGLLLISFFAFAFLQAFLFPHSADEEFPRKIRNHLDPDSVTVTVSLSPAYSLCCHRADNMKDHARVGTRDRGV
jgi:hypothetical protein